MDSRSSHSTSLSCMLDSGANLTVDGALATELEARGCDLDDPLWSAKVLLEQPQLIKQVHRDYFDAGAAVAITSSYQALPQGFSRRGIAEAEALELVALSVRLADEARGEYLAENPDAGPLLIAGSVGPMAPISRTVPSIRATTSSPSASSRSSTGRAFGRSWRPPRTCWPVRRCPPSRRLRPFWRSWKSSTSNPGFPSRFGTADTSATARPLLRWRRFVEPSRASPRSA